MMEWYKRRPGNYRRKTRHLSLAEHGAYNLLIDEYYSVESPLPADDHALASIIGKPLDEWLAVKKNVLPFFTKSGGVLRNKHCEVELEEVSSRRAGGLARQEKHRNPRKDNETVTSDSRVSNDGVTRLSHSQDETREEEKEKKESPPLIGGGGDSSSRVDDDKEKHYAHQRMMDINAGREWASRIVKFGDGPEREKAEDFMAWYEKRDRKPPEDLLGIPDQFKRPVDGGE